MKQKSKTKDTITRREMCQLTGLALNTINGRLLSNNYTKLVPSRVEGGSSAFVYNREKAMEWIKEWNGEAKKKPAFKLMVLNVKPKKHKKTVQSLDNLKKPSYHQEISD
jgi:hypothetical protein